MSLAMNNDDLLVLMQHGFGVVDREQLVLRMCGVRTFDGVGWELTVESCYQLLLKLIFAATVVLGLGGVVSRGSFLRPFK